WAENPLLHDYHDREFGVPVYDDQKLFEMLSLEGAQAGLSWLTIIKKRDNYLRAFDDFDIAKVAQYDEHKIDELLNDPGLIRNRLKIHSVVNNARCIQRIQREVGSFSHYIWSFVDHQPIQDHFSEQEEVPAQTPISQLMSKRLKKQGFKFVGPVICYSFMQAIGMVNDHTTNCFRYQEIAGF
ncbi:MAG: DNA-3-methyladenine glycosylase I, partial [Psychroflexus sp.]|nr:DNA-3-methyladenine glycosylase I [Psychroflexus sp.]MDR9449545.1 DNA-3-methyladenine glycosylase I [Psychroflexus sp.]